MLRRLPPYGGGTESQAVLLAEALRDCGHSVTIIGGDTLPRSNDFAATYLPDSTVRFWGTIVFHVSFFRYLYFYGKTIDVIQPFLLNETTLLTVCWSIVRKKSFIYKVTNTGRLGVKVLSSTGVRKKLCWKLIRSYASAVIAISKTMQQELEPCCSNIYFIPNGVKEIKNPGISFLPVKQNKAEFTILCVGRLTEQKHFDLAIRILPLVKKNVVLRIAGDGIEKKNLEQLAQKLQVQKRVYFMGYQNPIYPLYHQADILLVCSDVEGLSNVMLEAMASGLPVISTPVSGAADIIDETNGWITEDMSVQSLYKTVHHVLQLPQEEIMKTRINAKKAIQKRYSISQVAKEYDHLLHNLTRLQAPTGGCDFSK